MGLSFDSLFPPADDRDEPTSNAEILDAVGGSDVIKSIQYGLIEGTTTASTFTATITEVVLANSVLIYLGTSSERYDPGASAGRLSFTNSVTITLTKGNANYDVIAPFCVIEFEDGVVKSNNTGTISITALSNTATVAAVDTTKSALFYLGVTCDAFADADDLNTRITLTNSTTITATVYSSGETPVVGYQLIEFN